MNGLCGCCQPAAQLTPIVVDNLPGLSAIAYRIGTYASFRESMLEAIAGVPELAGLLTRRDDDYSITTIDLWAAIADVLTFYQERYANECFLRTAQQPESIRRIARLIDYRPRPGVAALAQLAFALDPGTTLQIPVGLKVQSVPPQNQQPQTFETIETIAADARFNRLRIYPQPAVINPLAAGTQELILDRMQGPTIAAQLAANDSVVLFNDSGTDLVEEKKIASIRTEDDRVIVRWTTPVAGLNWDQNTRVWKFNRKFHLFGYNAPPFYMNPTANSKVPGGVQWTPTTIQDFSYPQGNEVDPRDFQDLLYLDARYSDLPASLRLLTADPSGAVFATVFLADEAQDVFGNLADTVTRLAIDTEVQYNDRRTVVVYEVVGPQLKFWNGSYGPSVNTAALYLPGKCVSDSGGTGVEVGRTILQNAFQPGVVIHPADMAARRELLLTDASGTVVQATVHGQPSIDPPSAAPGDFCHLVLLVDSEAFQFDTSSAVVLGNVALASHGETVSNESLGSGNASQKFQSFKLQKFPLTYVPDASPAGASSSLQVTVNQTAWKEVAELYGQPGTARVYSTFTAPDDLHTVVQFGDSNTGAVLPTGQANVVANYRFGAGLGGRVGANSLTTILTRITNLNSATNPLPAEGGADPETMDRARVNAPRTVRTFGRAVSLRDFEDLVTASGEVAKAVADFTWDGFAPAINLTVAGQQAGTFTLDGLLRLGLALNAARDPNHRLILQNFARLPILVSATVLTDPSQSKDAVLAAALAALLSALSFDNLNLGQSIHLSSIFSVLQNVPGVVAADVILLGFKQPASMTTAQFLVFLASRGVTFLPTGEPAPVQPHLRIFTARPDGSNPGSVLSAEIAFVETPAQDVVITAQGS
jgi:hypothetical protein